MSVTFRLRYDVNLVYSPWERVTRHHGSQVSFSICLQGQYFSYSYFYFLFVFLFLLFISYSFIFCFLFLISYFFFDSFWFLVLVLLVLTTIYHNNRSTDIFENLHFINSVLTKYSWIKCTVCKVHWFIIK